MGKGKLLFKGDSKKKKKKSKHSIKSSISSHVDESATTVAAAATVLETEVKKSQEQEYQAPTIQKGIGLLTSSGTVLMGHDTRFTKSINPGDAIIIQVPIEEPTGTSTTREEMRIVSMRLSDTSASISSAFSNDLKTPTAYKYIHKPRNIRKEKADKLKKEKTNKEEIERNAFGTYSGAGGGNAGTEFVYRERTVNGGYRIRRENIQESVTRSNLLSMRSQKKSDKYC
jgi:hypothetical protein